MSKDIVTSPNALPSSKSKTWSVEIVYTLETLSAKVNEILDKYYGEWDPIRESHSVYSLVKRVLDSCLWQREVELSSIHTWPYTIAEIKEALLKISESYHYQFNMPETDKLDTILLAWIRNLPSPETISEGDFDTLIAWL